MKSSCGDLKSLDQPHQFSVTGFKYAAMPKPERRQMPTLNTLTGFKRVPCRKVRGMKSVTPTLKRSKSPDAFEQELVAKEIVKEESIKKIKARSVSFRPYKINSVPSKSPNKTPKTTKVTPEKSLEIGIMNFRLPSRYPDRFSTYSEYKNGKGVTVPLLHRDKVARLLHEVHDVLTPITKKFKLFFTCLSENHPTKGKVAVTFRVPLKFEAVEKPVFAHYIQLRVRNKHAPNDPEKFYNRLTLFAVMFHELAHIQHMNHGSQFMVLLRDIFSYANRIGIIPKEETNQLPSCRDWEKQICERRGLVSNEELMILSN